MQDFAMAYLVIPDYSLFMSLNRFPTITMILVLLLHTRVAFVMFALIKTCRVILNEMQSSTFRIYGASNACKFVNAAVDVDVLPLANWYVLIRMDSSLSVYQSHRYLIHNIWVVLKTGICHILHLLWYVYWGVPCCIYETYRWLLLRALCFPLLY